ncbi:MAG: hypothetical protein IKZ30_01035 [Oscillospiraceae bacterium]|nr:hypothetical protein [Oscillospiraceae bacterium]
MKKRTLLAIVAAAVALCTASAICAAKDKRNAQVEPHYYTHDESAGVTVYPDVTAAYETVEMQVSNIELRGDALTLCFYISQMEHIEEEFFGAKNVSAIEIALDPNFENTLEYKGIVQLEDVPRDFHLYTLSEQQADEAHTLYMRFPVVWKGLGFDPLSDDFDFYSVIPDTQNSAFDENGVYTGDLSGFEVKNKGEDWFKVTKLSRYKTKDERKRTRFYVTMEIEFSGKLAYLPGTVYLYANNLNGKFIALDARFEDVQSFARGSTGTLTFEVAKSTYKNFKTANCI